MTLVRVFDAEGSCVEDVLEVGEMGVAHFGEFEAVRDLRRGSAAKAPRREIAVYGAMPLAGLFAPAP